MKSSTKPFPKTKIQWLWENMEGKRALYLIGMIGTVLYNVLQLTIPYFSGKIVDLFLTGENAVQGSVLPPVDCDDWLHVSACRYCLRQLYDLRARITERPVPGAELPV